MTVKRSFVESFVENIKVLDRSEAQDAKRFRWLLSGHGYFMEEQYLCGHWPTDERERDEARAKIDEAMQDEMMRRKGDGR